MPRQGRALFVHPGIYEDANPHAFPPWGALAVAGAARRAGWEVRVLDLNGVDVVAHILAACEEFEPHVVGFTTKLGLGAKRFYEAKEALRASYGNAIRIVAGGPLVATFPSVEHPLWQGVDALIQGDGERACVTWMEAEQEGPTLLFGGDAADLDGDDWGEWWEPLVNYVRPAEYWPNMRVPGMHISAARGCTRRCTFCYLNSHAMGTRFRYASAEALFARLEHMASTFSMSGFYFVDDCFIDRTGARLSRFLELCTDAGSPFRFGCDVQLSDLADHELLDRMYTAGFRNFYVGVESASSATRKRLGKGSARILPDAVLTSAIEQGFAIRASIGIGWPGEKADAMMETIDLIDRVPGLAFDAYKFLPLPGTPLGEEVYWGSRRQQPLTRTEMLDDCFQDYSALNGNYSEVDDKSFGELWEEMCVREGARLATYASTAESAPAE